MRLDRFLWFARLSPSRSLAQGLASGGHLRIDGRRIDKASAPVRVGAVLSFATCRGDIRVLRVMTLPLRRGPPDEARSCYADLAIDAAPPQS